jgi:hypothetical protein
LPLDVRARQARPIASSWLLHERRRFPRRNAAHGGDKRVAGVASGLPGVDNEPVAHDDDAVRGGEDLAQQMRDEDAAAAGGNEAAHESEQLPGHMGVERRGRFVQNDQPYRDVRHRKGAGDLDHLTSGDGEVADKVAG